jgi:hypothetical protein
MFELRRWHKPPEIQPHGGGDMIAQHAAEGGVLGEVENESSPPGTIEVLTQTLKPKGIFSELFTGLKASTATLFLNAGSAYPTTDAGCFACTCSTAWAMASTA